MTINFKSTFLLCDVYVGPPCSEQTGDDLTQCVQLLIDARCGRQGGWPPPGTCAFGAAGRRGKIALHRTDGSAVLDLDWLAEHAYG